VGLLETVVELERHGKMTEEACIAHAHGMTAYNSS
jgi:hypothetical protein